LLWEEEARSFLIDDRDGCGAFAIASFDSAIVIP